MSINRQKLLGILGSPNEISDKDLEELEEAVSQTPYFQLGHALIAKAKYDRQSPDAYDSLSHAAIYAPNRGILKKIFYDNLSIDHQAGNTEDIQTVANEPEEDVASAITQAGEVEESEHEAITAVPQESEGIHPETETISTVGDQLPVEETADIFAEAEETKEEVEVKNETEEEISDTETEGKETLIIDEPTGKEEISIKNKEEDEEVYRELQENLNSLRKNKIKFDDEVEDTEGSGKKKTLNDPDLPENEEADLTTPPASSEKPSPTENKSTKSKREKGNSRLITEISLLEPLPSDQPKTKQQTQFSLIDKFINTEPEISFRDQPTDDTPLSDLSEENTLVLDHLLTENFAAIMLKQGKVDKALEIYRKLIWKFPQKKAYFASKIKALKESE